MLGLWSFTRTALFIRDMTYSYVIWLILIHDGIKCAWCIYMTASWLICMARCNTLQHTATHFNTLQRTATHCNTLQHTATHCNTLQHTATHCNTLHHVLGIAVAVYVTKVCCSVLQCATVCCSVLQCVAVCCSVLQCAAVCCSVLQSALGIYVAVYVSTVWCSALQCVAVCCSVMQCVAVCTMDRCCCLHLYIQVPYKRDLYQAKRANNRDLYWSKEPYKKALQNHQLNVLGIAVAVHVSIKRALYTKDLYQTKGANNRGHFAGLFCSVLLINWSKEPNKRALQNDQVNVLGIAVAAFVSVERALQ